MRVAFTSTFTTTEIVAPFRKTERRYLHVLVAVLTIVRDSALATLHVPTVARWCDSLSTTNVADKTDNTNQFNSQRAPR